ncbi:hypothetical protein ES703_85693 [subsurface metagenome]
MAEPNNKKKTPIALFLLVFVAVLIVMFIANYRSPLIQTLRGPKDGVQKLSTYGEHITAISRSNKVYSWDWNDLSGQPQVRAVNAQKVVAMSAERLIGVLSGKNNVLVVSNLKGDRELKRLPLGVGKKCKQLEVSPNGKYAVAAVATDGGSDNDIELAVTDADLTSISQVVIRTLERDEFPLHNIGVSNDGALVTAVGGKYSGQILVANTQSKQVLWEQTIANSSQLNNVIFSPDGQMIFASEEGRYVYVFESATGKLIRRLAMDIYETPPNNPQTISCIAVSPDGRLLTASSAPASRVWVWDVKSGAKIEVIGTGHFWTSGISFSPDSSLLAISDLTTSPIKIWRISGSELK